MPNLHKLLGALPLCSRRHYWQIEIWAAGRWKIVDRRNHESDALAALPWWHWRYRGRVFRVRELDYTPHCPPRTVAQAVGPPQRFILASRPNISRRIARMPSPGLLLTPGFIFAHVGPALPPGGVGCPSAVPINTAYAGNPSAPYTLDLLELSRWYSFPAGTWTSCTVSWPEAFASQAQQWSGSCAALVAEQTDEMDSPLLVSIDAQTTLFELVAPYHTLTITVRFD